MGILSQRETPKRVVVTELQRRVHTLRHETDPPRPWVEISMEIYGHKGNQQNVRHTYKAALKNIEREGEYEHKPILPTSIEAKNPEAAAVLMDAATNTPDMASLLAMAKKAGIPASTAHSFVNRLRSIYYPTLVEVKSVKTRRLRDLWETNTERALAAMTPDKFEEASLRDLAVMAGIGTEKVLLLRGQPTEIVRTETDRVNLQDLVGKFILESQRRGYEVEPDPANATVNLVHKGTKDMLDGKVREKTFGVK